MPPPDLTPDLGSDIAPDIVQSWRHWREHVPRTAPFTGVLMCPPAHFAIIDEKNAFMAGQIGAVDRDRAAAQWNALADTYRALGVAVHVLPAAPGREDMVFTANPALVVPRALASGSAPAPALASGSAPAPALASGSAPGARGQPAADVLLSHMNHPSRQAEVAHVGRWLGEAGFPPRELPATAGRLEGHGDVLVVPGRRLLLGGHGGRSEFAALLAAAVLLEVPLVPLALHGAPFYHLDTCLALLDENTLLLHPPAFEADALDTLGLLFPRWILADADEARTQLACNVHALRDGRVLLPAGARATAVALADAGYTPVPVDVSEFHKSGGSVFCLKLELTDLPAA